MTIEKSARVIFVARQGIQPRTGGKVAEEIGVIAEIAIGQPAGFHRASRVCLFGIGQIRIDIRPEHGGVTDEFNAMPFGKNIAEPLVAGVESFVLKMHQHRHVVFQCQRVNHFHLRRIDRQIEFLLADTNCPLFQTDLDSLMGLWQIRHFVGGEIILVRMSVGDGYARIHRARAPRTDRWPGL